MTGRHRVGRVHGRTAFVALRASRQRVRRGPITVTLAVGPADESVRVAYAIGRPVGGAVVRNRLRRRLRAAVAELDPGPGTYLIAAGPAAANLSYGELKRLVSEAVQELGPSALGRS